MKIAILLSVLLSGCSTCGAIQMPPKEYDHVPSFMVSVYERPFKQIPQYCAEKFAEACYQTTSHIIYLPEGLNSTEKSCLLRHEFGHANGWPGNHPDYHYE